VCSCDIAVKRQGRQMTCRRVDFLAGKTRKLSEGGGSGGVCSDVTVIGCNFPVKIQNT
jgi:hypothetical protein